MTKPAAILILLFFAPLLALAHGEKIPIEISGVVSEKGGAAVEGATISIERNGEVIQSTQTDAGGRFSLKVEGPIGRSDQIRLRVYKKGFKTGELLPVCCNDARIVLERKKPVPILRPFGSKASLSI